MCARLQLIDSCLLRFKKVSFTCLVGLFYVFSGSLLRLCARLQLIDSCIRLQLISGRLVSGSSDIRDMIRVMHSRARAQGAQWGRQ
jgi:hypothetical protein